MEALTTEEQEMFIWLDTVRESGQINMFAAPYYLQKEFGIKDKNEARRIVKLWMDTYSERHL